MRCCHLWKWEQHLVLKDILYRKVLGIINLTSLYIKVKKKKDGKFLLCLLKFTASMSLSHLSKVVKLYIHDITLHL